MLKKTVSNPQIVNNERRRRYTIFLPMHSNIFTYIYYRYTVWTHSYYLTPTPHHTTTPPHHTTQHNTTHQLNSAEHTIDASIQTFPFIISIAFQWIANEKKTHTHKRTLANKKNLQVLCWIGVFHMFFCGILIVGFGFSILFLST